MAERLAISTVIPAYNRAHMLECAVASAFAQRPLPPAEVIVVDDGSGDDTAAVAERLGATVIRHPHNRGLAAARNTGLEAAACDWVAFLDSDDEWLPHHLAHLWALRDGHALVASSALRCGADPATARIHGPATRRPTVLRSPRQLVHPGNIVPVSASMARRDVALAAGGFQARRGVVEDLDLWLRVLVRGTAVCSPQIGIVYRLHDAQMSAQDDRTMQLAHLDAGEARRADWGGSRTPLRRFEGVAAWDNMRSALRSGRRRVALQWGLVMLRRPQRALGAAQLLAHRLVLRRRVQRTSEAGVRADAEHVAAQLSAAGCR
ncbi:MAG TPA: glycosyltransferase family 2 protein [Conexibacter sp.]|nr:glycosyltransferase family 2 protein [Conexibacter sp.]